MYKTIYLDHNATTPVHELVRAQVPAWLELYGNPSSIHWGGRGPKALLRESRQNLAQALGVNPLELIYTSGGSEANNLALRGMVPRAKVNGRNEIVISAVEHPSVRKTAQALGFIVRTIQVNQLGELDVDQLENSLNSRTALVSVMYANNETGHIFPLRQVAELTHQVGAKVHCDAVQALGKVPLTLAALGVDMASISGHKFYALKGCGVLYVKTGTALESQISGGGQERGRRAGTENLLAIASLGLMCGQLGELPERILRMRQNRDHFEAEILQKISGVRLIGSEGSRLPNTSCLMIDGVDGETLMMNLDVHGVAVSTGAACSSGSPEPSPVLLGMGFSRSEAQSSLRVSMGWESTLAEVDSLVDILRQTVTRLRGFQHGERFVYGI